MRPVLLVQDMFELMPPWGWSCGSLGTSCVHMVINGRLRNDVCAGVGSGSAVGIVPA